MIDVLCLPWVTTASGFNPVSNSTAIGAGRIKYEYPMNEHGDIDDKWDFTKTGTGFVNANSIFDEVTLSNTSKDLSALRGGTLMIVDQNSPVAGDVVFRIPSTFTDLGVHISVDLIDASGDWVSNEVYGRLDDSNIPADGTNTNLERLGTDDIDIVVSTTSSGPGARLVITQKELDDVLLEAQSDANDPVTVADAVFVRVIHSGMLSLTYDGTDDAYSYISLYDGTPTVDNGLVADDIDGDTMVVEFYSDSFNEDRRINRPRWSNITLAVKGDVDTAASRALGEKYARLVGRLGEIDRVSVTADTPGTWKDAISVAWTNATEWEQGIATIQGTQGGTTASVSTMPQTFQQVTDYGIITGIVENTGENIIAEIDLASTDET